MLFKKCVIKKFSIVIFVLFFTTGLRAGLSDDEGEESRASSQTSNLSPVVSNAHHESTKSRKRRLGADSPASPSKIKRTDTVDSLPWTHSTHTIYVTTDARVEIPSKKMPARSFSISGEFSDYFKQLNEDLFQLRTNKSVPNHLFVTLRVGYKSKNESDLSWDGFILKVNVGSNNLRFVNCGMDEGDHSYADFFTQPPKNWQQDESRNVRERKVKYVARHETADDGKSKKHSEGAALSWLETNKDFIYDVLRQLNPGTKLKVVQVGLHSLLDFCKDCEHMLYLFQCRLTDDLRKQLLSGFFPNLLVEPDKASRLVVLVTGFNNRPYKLKKYHFFDVNEKEEHQFEVKGWGYLRRFRPFSGILIPNVCEVSSRLVTVLLEPVKETEQWEILLNDRTAVLPLALKRTSLALNVRNLYTDPQNFIRQLTPDLLTIDLTRGRLGIKEEEIDEDIHSISGSNGREIVECFSAMELCTQVRNLYISHNWLNHAGEAFRSLKTFSHLQVLALAKCNLWGEQVRSTLRELSESLKFLTNLRELDLSGNGMNSDHFHDSLAERLLSLKTIHRINLSQNRLSLKFFGSSGNHTDQTLVWACNFLKERLFKQNQATFEEAPCVVNLRGNHFSEVDINVGVFRQIGAIGCTLIELIQILARMNLRIQGIPYDDSEPSDSESENESFMSCDEMSENDN